METIAIAAFLFFVIALLYSSIGHAGASGYLAVMALLSFDTSVIKPTSLILNIVVSAIASYKFISEGYFDRKIFLHFALFSVPASFIGGSISLPPFYFKILAGGFLLVSAILLLIKKEEKNEHEKVNEITWLWGGILGTLIGLVSGIIGVGGGIFLTPILVIFKWAPVKKAAGISALFILFNSVSALLGHTAGITGLNRNILYLILVVSIGGFIGSHLGAKKLTNKVIVRCLALILLSAGLKLLFADAAM